MPDKKFDLGDYVEVKDRIAIFYELYPKGSLVTGSPELMMVDGKPYLLLQAYAYRTPDDPHPGVGTSWMAIPGATTYTKGSEAENVETSAWGRAIGSLGILIDKSIASAQEVQNKQEDRPAPAHLPPRTDAATADPPPPPDAKTPYSETTDLIGRERRQGIIRKGTSNHYKLEPHIGPEGAVLGFKLDTGKGNIPQCVTTGALGDKLMLATGGKPESLVGQRATVAGKLLYVKGNKTSEGWYRLEVDTFENDEWVLTAEADEPKLPEPPEDLVLVGEKS